MCQIVSLKFFSGDLLKDSSHGYGSLYVTLCFVLYPFDFGVLTIFFCMLSSLFVYNVPHFKRRNSRGRAKMENKRGKKDESISIFN